jgi:NitT/TauT family transport system substrate-binding protein
VKLLNVRAWSAVAGAVLLSAAAGCSASGNSGNSVDHMPIVTGLETTNLTVYYSPAIDSAGLFIAKDEGLFAKEGLNVTISPDLTSSQDTIDNIESGKGQIASPDYVTLMDNFAVANTNLEVVVEGSVLQPNVLTLMVNPRSGIKTLKQLQGKQIPVSGQDDIGALLIDSLLFENNVPYQSIHYVLHVSMTDIPFKVAAGVFAAGPVPEPYIAMGEQQAGDTVLADLNQGAMTNFPIQGYVVTKQWAQQHPNTLKAFVTALEQGQQIADTNRSALEQAIENHLQVPAAVAAVISLPNFPIGVDPARLQRVMTDMIQFGFFTPQQLTAAKAFRAQDHVYTENLLNSNGLSNLLGG